MKLTNIPGQNGERDKELVNIPKPLTVEQSDVQPTGNSVKALDNTGMPLSEEMSAIMAASAEETHDDPKSYPEAPFVCNIADCESVSLSSGTLQYTVTDFVLPGRNGFDLNITRQYDSGNANCTDMDPQVDVYSSTYRTESRLNAHNYKQYGLGFGWRFMLPSIEVVPVAQRTFGIEYSTHLHLDDGRSFEITGSSLKDYTMKDVWIEITTGTVTHPQQASFSQPYHMIVNYQNGNKDYFRQFNDSAGQLDYYRLAARQDRFGNTIYFTYGNGGIEIIDTWGRTVSLERVDRGLTWHLPDGSTIQYKTEDVGIEKNTGKKLVAVIDQLCRTTTYDYDHLAAHCRYFSLPYDPGTNITYVLLKQITHQSGAVTQYQYGIDSQSTPLLIAFGGVDSYRQFYPIRARKDVADGVEYNAVSYSYTRASSNMYISSALIQRPLGVTEKQTFNDKGQLTAKEVHESGVLVLSSEMTYGTDKDAADYKLMKSEQTKQYNRGNAALFIQANTDLTYTADKCANVEKRVETYPDDPSLNQETRMSYGAWGIMTEKTVRMNDDTVIRECYVLRSVPDNKVVEYRLIYEEKMLREKTQYIYGSGANDSNCVVNERRFFAAEDELLENAQSYVETQYAYDSGQYTAAPVETRVVGIQDADGQPLAPMVTTVAYDCMGRPVRSADADGYVTDIEYDAAGRVVCERYPAVGGRRAEKRNVYNDGDNTITTINENGVKTRLAYTKMGQIRAEYAALYDKPHRGDTLLKSFGYDTLGRLIAETVWDGEGGEPHNIRAVTQYAYDAQGRTVSTRIDAAGYLETESCTDVYADPQTGRKWLLHTKTVHGDGQTPDMTTSEYVDQAGRKRYEFADGQLVLTTEYDKLGNALAQTDARGNKTSTLYDYAGRAVIVIRQLADRQLISRSVYDALGNKIRDIDPAGGRTDSVYDKLGRLLRKSADFDHRRAVEEYSYDGRGNVTMQRTATDTGWRESSYEYDQRGRQTAATLWLDDQRTAFSRTEYDYDAIGNKTEVRAGLSEHGNSPAIQRYAYDRFGNVVAETDALGQTSRSEYDATGRLIAKTDRNGAVTQYEYDCVGRVTMQRAGGSVRQTIYNAAGQKQRETAAEGETELAIEYTYDARGRIIEQRDPGEAVKRFTYDAMGNRTRFTLHRNNLVEPEISLWYTYDELNRVTAISNGSETIATYSYDLRGNRTMQRYPAANLETSYGYNLAGLMTELYNKKNGKVVSQFKYTYDIDGNQLTKLNGELETAYEYDKLGRLIAEREVNGNTYLYEYDAFSNRSKLVVSGYDNYATTYEYDINNRLLAETRVEKDFTEKSAYTYDKNGNQIRRTTETIEGKKPWSPPERHLFITAPQKKKARVDIRKYNGFGQLVEVYRDGQRIDFSYRPDGMRHNKVVSYPFKPSLNRSTTHFWDGQSIVLETNASNEVKAKYLRGAQLIAQVIGEELFYYLNNAHGDVIQRIAENGTSAPQYKYDAFGNQIAPSYAPRSLSAFSKLRFSQLCFSFGAGELDPNPFRYCGEYFDEETGDIYLRARYYDPRTGRFGAEDSAKHGQNWYLYCGANPIRNIDPSGMSFTSSLVNGIKKAVSAVADSIISTAKKAIDAITNAAKNLTKGYSDIKDAPKKTNYDNYAYNDPAAPRNGAQSVMDKITGTKKAERLAMIINPIAGITAYNDSRTAIAVTNALYGETADGSIGNAFQHMYWNALMSHHIGAEKAEGFGTAHETYSKGTDMDENVGGYSLQQHVDMDLYNNQIGREIGAHVPDDIQSELVKLLGSEEAVNAIEQKYQVSGVELYLAILVQQSIENGQYRSLF